MRARRAAGVRALRQVVIAAMVAALGASPLQAARILPDNLPLGTVRGFDYPFVDIGGTIYRMAPGARIFDRNNRVVIPPRVAPSSNVMFGFDTRGQVFTIWVLTPEEIERLARQR